MKTFLLLVLVLSLKLPQSLCQLWNLVNLLDPTLDLKIVRIPTSDDIFQQLEDAKNNISIELPKCLNPKMIPSLGCGGENITAENFLKNLSSSLSTCLLEKICYNSSEANVVNLTKCLTSATGVTINTLLNIFLTPLGSKIYLCIISLYTSARSELLNCEFFNKILSLDIHGIAKYISDRILHIYFANLVNLIKLATEKGMNDCILL
ncbi:uncharacterized protein LOC111640796, partial [Centruroides sculpturatus]|uniref:uncharacterized protein LOC111640796 n=1 Tax=Centruroides sculpturatus TaxID=218467 RepID=UPI000C6DD27C